MIEFLWTILLFASLALTVGGTAAIVFVSKSSPKFDERITRGGVAALVGFALLVLSTQLGNPVF